MSTNKCILATGGAGYVGSHTVVELLDAGYDVVVMDNLANATMESITRVEELTGKKVPTYNVDLLDKERLRQIFTNHKIHCVMHFAGFKAVGRSVYIPLEYYKNNIGGTVTLLEVMREFKVHNMIFSSSATVYGEPEYLPFDEKHKTGGCTNPYGKTKFFLEEIFKDLHTADNQWNIVLLRYFNPIGAHKSGKIGESPIGVPHNLMPYISKVAAGELPVLTIYGNDYDTKDGTGVRDYTHVVDLAQGHVAALKSVDKNCGLKIYNLGTGKAYSVLEMVAAFEKVSGKKVPYKFAPRRSGDLPTFWSDVSLAEKELGWKAKYGLEEMCYDIWRWQTGNPGGYGMSSKKCVLATGGAGYVGSHTVVELLDAGYDVVVMDNLSNSTAESIKRVEELTGKRVPTYITDLLDKEGLRNIFTQHKIDCVMHFAGFKAVGRSVYIPLEYYRNNVGGTVTLLEVMREFKVHNMIFSSSATVYGEPEYLPFDEKHKTGGCTNPYGKTKFFIEEIFKDLHTADNQWNIVLLRYFNPIGAHKSGKIGESPIGLPHNLMPNISKVAAGELPILTVYGNDYDTKDGTGVRDYTHVVDLAQGHVAAMKSVENNCGIKIYNLGTGKAYSVLEMVQAFEKVSGKKVPYKFAPRRSGDLPTFWSDVSLAEKELGWKATMGLEEMCKDIWRWQDGNPGGYGQPDFKQQAN